jgi:putative membrane protein
MRSDPALVPARRLHLLSPVFFAARHVRGLWPLLLLLLARRDLALVVAGAAALLAWTSLEWLRRTYALEGGALRLEEGVLARRRRVVPFDRIQQVDLVRRPLHRLLGVATLRVETAGGSRGAEVDLDVIALADAQALRATLLRARAAAEPGPAAGPPERAVVRLSLAQVALAGVTGSRALALLAVLGPLSQAVDWVPDRLLRRIDLEAFAPTSPAAVAGLVVLGAIVWLGLAATSSVVTDAGFTLARAGDELVVRRGLLERREAVVPLARVQVVRVEESLLRRLLGLASLRVQSAGRVGGSDRTAARLAVPLLPAVEVNRVLGELLPGAAPVPLLRPAPAAARRRAVVRRVVPAAVAAVALTAWLAPWGALALAAVPLAAATGLAAYGGLGHATAGGFLYARRGALLRTLAVVPIGKAQSGRVSSTVFQRRSGLATLHVDVAGGGPTPRVLDEAEPTTEALLAAVAGRPPR